MDLEGGGRVSVGMESGDGAAEGGMARRGSAFIGPFPGYRREGVPFDRRTDITINEHLDSLQLEEGVSVVCAVRRYWRVDHFACAVRLEF